MELLRKKRCAAKSTGRRAPKPVRMRLDERDEFRTPGQNFELGVRAPPKAEAIAATAGSHLKMALFAHRKLDRVLPRLRTITRSPGSTS
jgi:hypothetical protein